jgi:hypothetical protein
MQLISAQHLAELLIGIARAQAAIGRDSPDAAAIVKDLERLCAGKAVSGSPGADLDFGAAP